MRRGIATGTPLRPTSSQEGTRGAQGACYHSYIDRPWRRLWESFHSQLRSNTLQLHLATIRIHASYFLNRTYIELIPLSQRLLTKRAFARPVNMDIKSNIASFSPSNNITLVRAGLVQGHLVSRSIIQLSTSFCPNLNYYKQGIQ
jgi:hypothetical protein